MRTTANAPLADIVIALHHYQMESPLQRMAMLPTPARVAVLSLILLPAVGLYLSASVREWQIGGSSAYAVTEHVFWSLGIGRSLGALLLATLLLYWRRPAGVAVTITAVWLAGPPLTFLWRAINVLAASAGHSSWAGDPFSWIVAAAIFPGFITTILLAPTSVRHAYAIS